MDKSISSRFQIRKQKLLEQLDAPAEEYHDLSPKGSVDEPIRALIHDVNQLAGLVTTSSCSGRISVFLEGRKADASQAEPSDLSVAGPGGKGGGGSWLFISHNAISVSEDAASRFVLPELNLKKRESADSKPDIFSRYIHLKFEPMILHILTASLEDSQHVLAAALGSGFRESGAVSLTPSRDGEINPMVAVRSSGYSFDAIIGYQSDTGKNIALVDETYLQTLFNIANDRFRVNSERIKRFEVALHEQYHPESIPRADVNKPEWEAADVRKQRKREEGLARQRAIRENHGVEDADVES